MRLRSPWTPYLSDRFTSPADRLVAALADDILDGKLETGARLPAHRDLADKLGIATGTVTKAYAVLERRGLVRTVKGSGTFVALTESRKGPAIDLSRNAPPPAMTERLLARTLSAVARRVDAGLFNDYPPPGGHSEHRRLLARWFASVGMPADPERLLLTSGAYHGLSVALSAALPSGRDSGGNDRGGTLFTEIQTYPGAIALARHQGLRLVGVAMDEQGILPEALDRALEQAHGKPAALYVTPTMHNPTTATMGLARRKAVVEVCRAHGIAIIEDDVYKLDADREHPPLALLAPERSFYINSLSKCLNPALRVGAVVAPAAGLKAAQAALRASAFIVSPLSCALVEQWLIDGTAEAIMRAIQDESRRRMVLATSVLGSRVRTPDYPGYHLWMPMARQEAERLHQAAASFGIVLTPPGASATSADAEQGGIRLCLGTPPLAELSSALATIARLRPTSPPGP